MVLLPLIINEFFSCSFYTPFFQFYTCIKTLEYVLRSFSSLNSEKSSECTFWSFFQGKQNLENGFWNIYTKTKNQNRGWEEKNS
jgi:hypothetical protein